MQQDDLFRERAALETRVLFMKGMGAAAEDLRIIVVIICGFKEIYSDICMQGYFGFEEAFSPKV